MEVGLDAVRKLRRRLTAKFTDGMGRTDEDGNPGLWDKALDMIDSLSKQEFGKKKLGSIAEMGYVVRMAYLTIVDFINSPTWTEFQAAAQDESVGGRLVFLARFPGEAYLSLAGVQLPNEVDCVAVAMGLMAIVLALESRERTKSMDEKIDPKIQDEVVEIADQLSDAMFDGLPPLHKLFYFLHSQRDMVFKHMKDASSSLPFSPLMERRDTRTDPDFRKSISGHLFKMPMLSSLTRGIPSLDLSPGRAAMSPSGTPYTPQ